MAVQICYPSPHTQCSAVISLGGIHGPLSYTPPTTYTPLLDAIDPTMDVRLIPFRCLGVSNDLIVRGPMILADYEAFVPAPIVTSGVSLPDPLLRCGLKDRLAENIHEVWAKNKIEAGYTYAEVSCCQSYLCDILYYMHTLLCVYIYIYITSLLP